MRGGQPVAREGFRRGPQGLPVIAFSFFLLLLFVFNIIYINYINLIANFILFACVSRFLITPIQVILIPPKLTLFNYR